MTTECTTCTIPTDSADGICQFCWSYVPPQLPHPPGALTVGNWRNTDGGDPAIPPFRDFTARQWVVEAARDTSEGWELGSHDTIVRIAGVQFATGRVKRWVEISGDTTLLPAEMVQQLGDALLAARHEIDRASAGGCEPVFSDLDATTARELATALMHHASQSEAVR